MKPGSAVLMPNWVGDFLLALSVVLRAAAGHEKETTLIVPERLAGLARLLCGCDILPYCRGTGQAYWHSVRRVKSNKNSKLYILPHSFSSALFAFFTRVPQRRGVGAELRGFLLTDRLSGALASRRKHLTHEYAEVLEVPFVGPSAWKGVRIPGDERYRGAIALCPGAAFGPAKQWPSFPDLVRGIPETRVVILGDGRDRGSAGPIAAAAPDRTVDLTGATTIEQAAGIIASVRAVVSNDSGLLHLAGFLGTPAVGVYGSTSAVWTRPLGESVRIASGSCPSAPCFERTCPLGSYQCLKNVGPETVIAMAKELVR